MMLFFPFIEGLSSSQKRNLGERKFSEASQELKRNISTSLGQSVHTPEKPVEKQQKQNDQDDLNR